MAKNRKSPERIDPNGCIWREADGRVIVEAPVDPTMRELLPADAVCINPTAPLAEHVYRREFRNPKKRVYLPDEYEHAVEECYGAGAFVIGPNGYSLVTEAWCARYAIRFGAYEAAVRKSLRVSIRTARDGFRGAKVRLASGASPMGVDGVTHRVARELDIPCLGHSCPRFMLFVLDDEFPTYVAATQEEYANRFIQSLHLLLTFGGRRQALEHDVLAGCLYRKRVHLIDLPSMLSATGTVPATIIGADGKPVIENAAAAMAQSVSLFSAGSAMTMAPATGDQFDALWANIMSVTTAVCRQHTPPDIAFSD